MAFRWKQPIEMAQQGKGGQDAADQAGPENLAGMYAFGMSGYVPNSAVYDPAGNAAAYMQGYNPTNPVAATVTEQPRWNGMLSRAPQEFNNAGQGAVTGETIPFEQYQIQKQIEQLEAQLRDIDARIAQIDKEVPGIGGNEWEIAAKRAEVGDYAAYDNIVNRGQNQIAAAKSAVAGMENELYNAAKLTWGLKAKSSEDREAAKTQIKVALDRTKATAEKTGAPLPGIYYELESKLAEMENEPAGGENIGNANARVTANGMWSKAKARTITDADINAIKAQIKSNPNGEETAELTKIVEQYENDTVEKRAAAAQRKKAAKAKIAELQKLPVYQQEQIFDSLSKTLQDDILKQAQWDTTSNRGLVWKR